MLQLKLYIMNKSPLTEAYIPNVAIKVIHHE